MSEGDLKKQLEIGVDASGVETGVAGVKQKLAGVGAAARQAGQEAREGIEGIGKGSETTSAKVDAATRSIQQSLQRTIAQLEAGSRSSSKFFEVLATQRGADLNVLKPYLVQLDEVQRKQAVATQALQASQPAMSQMGISARQLSAAMRGVPAQFTDIVTALQAGQNPITVFLQQGGQLKDMFGGLGPAARALGGYVLGLVNPFTVAAAAAGVLALAYFQGSKEADGYARAIVMSGNTAAATVAQYQAAAAAASRLVGTQGAAAEVVAGLGATGKVAADNLGRFTEVALRLERDAGVPIKETIKNFEELGKSPAEAALKLNERLNFLTAATYNQIRSLEEQGRVTEAAALAQKTFADAMDVRAKQLEGNLGYIERAWRAIAGAAKGAWDAMLDVGRKDSLAQLLDQARARLQRLESQPLSPNPNIEPSAEEKSRRTAAIDRARQEIALLQEQERLMRRGAEAAATRNRLEAAAIEFSKEGVQYLSKQEKLRQAIERETVRGQELIAAGLTTQAQLTERIAAIREEFKEKGTGAAPRGETALAQIQARIAAEEELIERLQARGAEAQRLTEGERLVLKIQKELETSVTSLARKDKEAELAAAQRLAATEKSRAALQQEAQATEKALQAHNKLVDSMQSSALSTLDQARAQETANATFGKSKVAIEQMVLAQLRDEQSRTALIDGTPAYLAALDAKVAAQERWVAALTKAEEKQLQLANDDWARANAEESETLRQQISLLGASQLEREKILALRRVEIKLAERLREIDRNGAGDDAKAAARAAARANAAAEAENALQRTVLEDWDRTNKAISDSFVDHLMRGGKSVAQYLKDLFRTLVLRPILQPIGNAFGNAVNSLTAPITNGIVGAVTQALVGPVINNLLPTLAPPGGIIDTALGAFGAGSGIGGTAIAGAEIASTVAATTESLVAAGASMAEASAAASALGESMAAAAGGVEGFLAAIPGWGWAAMAALAIFALTSEKGGPKADGRFGVTVSDIGAAGTTPALNTAAMQSVAGLQTQFDALAKSIGLLNANVRFGVGISTDPEGDSPSFLDFTATRNGTTVFHDLNRNVGRSQQELQAALEKGAAQAMVGALQAVANELPESIRSILAGVDTRALDSQTAGAIIQRIAGVATAVKDFGTLVAQMPFQQLRDLSFDASAGLIAAAGGLEQLTSGLGTYYAEFFSAEEQRAQTIRNIQAALSKGGLQFTDAEIGAATRQQFRALVESLDVTSESGQKSFAALMSVAGAFASLTEEADAATTRLDNLRAETKSLEVELLRAQGRMSEAAALQRSIDTAGMTAAEIAIYDYNAALRAQVETVQKQATAMQRVTESIKALQSETRSLEVDLLRAQGKTGEADALQRSIDTADMTAAEIAIYDYNAALRAQVTAVQAVTQSIETLRSETQSLEVDLLRAQGNIAEANALQRSIDTAGMTAAEIAIYDYNAALRAQIEAVNSATKLVDVMDLFLSPEEQKQARAQTISTNLAQAGLVIDADVILGATREQFRTLYLEVAASGNDVLAQALLDNAALFASITPEIDALARSLAGLQAESQSLEVELLRAQGKNDEADALQRSIDTAGFSDAELAIYDYNAALRAQITAVRQAAQVAAQRQSLEIRILELEGNKAAARALELAATEESLRPLKERLWLLEDEAEAEQKRKAAAEQAASAARQLHDAWKSLTDTLLGEVRRLRGEIGGNGEAAMAQLQSQFAIATAQARAGDQEAARDLPALASAIERLADSGPMSQLDVDFIRGQLAGSLSQTAAILAQQFGLQLSGANQALLAGVQTSAPQQPLPTQPPAGTTFTSPRYGDNPAMRVDARQLQQEVIQLRDELRSLRLAVETGLIPQAARTANAVNGAGEQPMRTEVVT